MIVSKYNIIYADPPWRYRKNVGQGIASDHYPTMRLQDICALPVADIAARDSALFIWATFPCLREAFEVINAWGFQFVTVAFVWIKQNRKSESLFWGLGHWTRANAEICLLAKRGKVTRAATNVHQVILSPREEHSKKPDEARQRIVRLMGDLPRIELFARQRADGWDAWGNEIASDIGLTI